MDYENEEFDTEEAEDVLPEVVEEPDEEPGESLDSLDEEGQEEEPKDTGEQVRTEPGYVQKRISKAVNKALAEAEARWEAQYAPIRERLLEMDAKELVAQRKVADLETAKELLRYRQGMAVTNEQTEQPREENGQFAPKEDPATSARIEMLKHQRDVINEEGGPDVVSEFQNNEEIKMKVISGEMDFYDVAKYMKGNTRKTPPSPMRSPNGASGTNPNAIDSMSDAQFERMEKRIKEGARYSLR